jgi:16S rRNA (guanine966-N2)-methyltransferase
VLVEAGRSAWHACRENVVTLDLPGVTLQRADAREFLAAGPARAFDVVFLDPPYAEPNATVIDVLHLLVGHGWCAEQGFVVAERSARGQPLDWPPGLRPLQDRRYGDATLWYGRALPAGRLPESLVPPADPRHQPPA